MKTPAHDQPPRGKYQGMMQILKFNWRFYLLAVLVLLCGGVGLNFLRLNSIWKTAAVGGLAIAGFWTIFSLMASHWIYDRSPICKWTWIPDCLPNRPQHWVNIHAGLDESSPALDCMFPGTDGKTLDIFNADEMTEASISEARLQSTGRVPDVHADFRALPLAAEGVDVVFLIFAAHEIRRTISRLEFFAELKRVLKPSGRVLIVEHPRDWRNFVAYGPGCFHFQSRRTWLSAAAQTGFVAEREFGITPYVRIFLFRKPL